MRSGRIPRARLALACGFALNLFAAMLVAAAAATAAEPQKPGVGGPLSVRLAALATKELRSASNAEQAEALSLPARGPAGLLRSEGSVVVEVRVSGSPSAFVELIEDAGADPLNVSRRYATITAAVAERDLRALASVPGVEAVTEVLEPTIAAPEGGARAIVPPVSRCAGSVTSEGDGQLGAAAARTRFNVDGSGIEVGVLSDSFDRDASASTSADDDVASGDLPGPGNPCGRTGAVEVLDDGVSTGGDEGRAMLQLVHDLAPGSPLSFATAFTGETAFADNIRALAGAGARVIVDDVGYFAEPAFQDGVVAEAINDVRAAGVTYYSAAGNDNIISAGNDVASWEAPGFRQAASCPPGLPSYANQCLDFDPGAGSDSTYGFSVAPGRTVRMGLHWAQPQLGVTTDIDIYALVGSTVVALSEDANLVSGKPFELIGLTNSGSSPATVDIAISRYTGAGGGDSGTPRLKLLHLNNGSQQSFPTEYGVSSGGDIVGPSIFGHSAADSAISTAAVPFDDAGVVETFSSRGPATHYFGPVVGTTPAPALPSPRELAKPDVAATDGGLTTFFGSGNRFFGTSAAAPHAAAVAALQLDANPTQTVAQIRNAQKTTAVPVGALGPFAVGSGLIDATGAVPANPPSSPTVTIASPGTTPDSTPSIAFTTTGDVKAATCSIDGAPPQPCGSPFTPAPLTDGPHTLEVIATDYFDQTGGDSAAFTVAGDGPGPPNGTAPSDDTEISGSASARRTQKKRGGKIVVKVKVKANEDLTAEAGGRIEVNPSYRLGAKTKSVGEGAKRTIRLRPRKRQAKKIARALNRGKRARAKLAIGLTDEAGNEETERLRVRLKR